MQSGLAFDENYVRINSDVTQMYIGGDLAGYAAARPLEAVPGTVWQYSTGTSNILGRIVSENAGAAHPERFSFPRRRLFEPLGMRHTVIEVDSRGNFVGGSSVFASARDYARFGLLYLRDGVWNGRRILPEGWVEYTLTPSGNVPTGRSYGAQVWLNFNPGSGELSWPSLPPDTFAMRGHQGQFVVGIPSQGLIVVRLGLSEFLNWDMESFVSEILALLPHTLGKIAIL
jgi:CubicO group peptidase (beta-lactamase class C family)